MKIKCADCDGVGFVVVPDPKEIEPCEVAGQFCKGPEEDDPDAKPLKTSCFPCGLPVCVECSVIRKYHKWGRKRLCDDCEVALDGNDKRLMARLHRKAGYEPCKDEKNCTKHDGHTRDQHDRVWAS